MPVRALLALVALAVIAAGSLHFGSTDAAFTQTTQHTQQIGAAADWTAPAVAVTDPGSPLRGSVVVAMTASDAGSGVASVRLESAPTGTDQWIPACTDTTAPYACTIDTAALPDGPRDFRAIARDNAANTATSVIVARRVVDNNAPVVTLADPGAYLRGTATLTAEASDAGTGLTSVRFERATAGSTSWTTICTDTAAPWSCSFATTATADDVHDLRAVAFDAAGNSTVAVQSDVHVDNTVPTGTVTVAASPVRGVSTLSTSPADGGAAPSGVAATTVQVSPAGTGAWQTACTASAAPWSCRWDSSSVKDGSYDFRSVVRDAADNTGVTPTVTRTVDNTVSSVAIEDPGAFLRGTVTLQASVTSPGAGASVAIQLAPTGTTTWTTVCTVTAAPWSCPFDTTTRADGRFDFRAVLADAAGTKTSATVADRVIDNTLVRGTDVQADNRSGITAGRIEAGDALTFSFSDRIAPGTLLTGWTGAAAQTIALRVRDGALTGGTSGADVADVFTDGTLRTPMRLGSLELKGDFVRAGKTAVFGASVALQTVDGRSVVTVTITGVTSGANALRTAKLAGALSWSPLAGITDLAGNPCSTAPVAETGALDRDF